MKRLKKENENRDKENDCHVGNVTYEILDLSCEDANVPNQKSLGSLSNIWNNVLFALNPSNLIFRPPGFNQRGGGVFGTTPGII
jgi:hypothetical protein